MTIARTLVNERYLFTRENRKSKTPRRMRVAILNQDNTLRPTGFLCPLSGGIIQVFQLGGDMRFVR